ncbi:MAG TPA: hypothetical protein VH396_12245 [Chitinophagaceae bacterium]
MSSKRLLITISFSFSIRYIVRTGLLHKLRSFCEPVIAIAWDQEDLISELRAQGFEVHIIPEHKREPIYSDVRRKIDIWFNRFCLKSSSRKIQQAYLDQYMPFRAKLLRRTRERYNIVKLYLPFYKKRLFKKEEQLLHAATNFTEINSFVDALNIDAVFTVTPFHKQEDILLRACKYKGKKMLTSILSFDNITKRGWIPVEYDLYIVWNGQNKEQLHRIYPFTKNKTVHVCGPAQFDFYFDKEYLWENCEWRRNSGINVSKERKIILYAGGPQELFPYEPYYLKDIDEAIRKGLIINQPIILFRCHPMDKIERWKSIIGDSNNIVFDNSWNGKQSAGYANVSEEDIKKLCSTLAYTDVHINLCSTMTVDGSAFGKPQIGPAYVHYNKHSGKLLTKMYLQEHFVPVIETKGLQLAHSSPELIRLINKALENGKTHEDGNAKILKSTITFCDGKNTERVAAALKDFLAKEN